MKNTGRIFISYRRDASQWQAFSIYYALKEVHNRLVFLDLVSMGSGDFEQMIFEAIDASRHFVLILSSDTLQKCISKNDFLRKEIERAIDKKRNIVPVFFDNFKFGDHEKLIHQIKLDKLLKCNGLEVTPGVFSECVESLNKKFLVGHNDIIEEDKKSTNTIIKFAQQAATINIQYPGTVYFTPSPNSTSYITGTADFWKLNPKEENLMEEELNGIFPLSLNLGKNFDE